MVEDSLLRCMSRVFGRCRRRQIEELARLGHYKTSRSKGFAIIRRPVMCRSNQIQANMEIMKPYVAGLSSGVQGRYNRYCTRLATIYGRHRWSRSGYAEGGGRPSFAMIASRTFGTPTRMMQDAGCWRLKIAARVADIARVTLVREIEMMRWSRCEIVFWGGTIYQALDPERACVFQKAALPKRGTVRLCSMCAWQVPAVRRRIAHWTVNILIHSINSIVSGLWLFQWFFCSIWPMKSYGLIWSMYRSIGILTIFI